MLYIKLFEEMEEKQTLTNRNYRDIERYLTSYGLVWVYSMETIHNGLGVHRRGHGPNRYDFNVEISVDKDKKFLTIREIDHELLFKYFNDKFINHFTNVPVIKHRMVKIPLVQV